MKRLVSLIMLDLKGVKQQLGALSLVALALQIILVAFLLNSIIVSVLLGVFLGLMLNNSAFYYDEKNNTYALYTLLGLRRNEIVLGRYVSALVLCLASVIFCIPFSAIGYFAAGYTSFTQELVFSPQAWAILAGILFICNAIQLPIYFKLGFSKARNVALSIPLIVIMAFGGFCGGFLFRESGLATFESFVTSSGFMVAFVVLVVITIGVSCWSSQLFMKKRDY